MDICICRSGGVGAEPDTFRDCVTGCLFVGVALNALVYEVVVNQIVGTVVVVVACVENEFLSDLFFKFPVQRTALALSRAELSAGSSIPARIAIIAIVTSSSTRVNFLKFLIFFACVIVTDPFFTGACFFFSPHVCFSRRDRRFGRRWCIPNAVLLAVIF